MWSPQLVALVRGLLEGIGLLGVQFGLDALEMVPAGRWSVTASCGVAVLRVLEGVYDKKKGQPPQIPGGGGAGYGNDDPALLPEEDGGPPAPLEP